MGLQRLVVGDCSGGYQLYGSNFYYKGARVTGLLDTTVNQQQTHTYDGFNRLTTINDLSHLAGAPGDYSYTYDRWGNRTSQSYQNGGTTRTYSYDGNNHRTDVSYDAAGN